MKHVGSGAPARFRMLVTGFGAFPGARSNPTPTILALLARRRSRLERLGIDLLCLPLPVTYAGIGPALRDAAAAHGPDAILHLGLAARRPTLCVETRALNRAGPLHPDAARRQPASRMLAPGGTDVLVATWPAERVLAAICATGLPARRSIDAGDYVCNATLYRTLAEGFVPQAGFLHVPHPRRPAQPVARSVQRDNARTKKRPARPTLAALAEAAMAAVIVMAREGRSEALKRKRRSSIG